MDYQAFLTPTLGIGGIIVLVIVMILRGDLVPRRQADAVNAVKDEQIALYKGLYEGAMTLGQERDRQIASLMETARTTRRVLEAIPEAARSAGGDDHEVA